MYKQYFFLNCINVHLNHQSLSFYASEGFFLILQTQNYRNLRVQMMKYTIDKHFCLHLHVYDFGICTLKFGSSREIIMCAENS